MVQGQRVSHNNRDENDTEIKVCRFGVTFELRLFHWEQMQQIWVSFPRDHSLIWQGTTRE